MGRDSAGVSVLGEGPAMGSPVGGAVLDLAPALPLRKDPRRRPGTSKGVTLDGVPLVSSAASLELQTRDSPSVGRRPAECVRRHQPIVLPTVVVPEGLVSSLVPNAELNQG